ncbi:MAG: adenylate kinase [Omnitrophica bacterium RBG_13_46_9]|nr:MAG: adenylate kinase [Omnitrophica bacterium RBG_13_46_9]
MNIVLLGPPGAGKGTLAKTLTKEFKIAHISTGDMLREAVKKGADIGKTAKKYMDRGELVPDDIVVSIVAARVSGEDLKNGFLLDGFPRNEKQADRLDNSLNETGKKLDLVLYLKTSQATSIKRLSGRIVCVKCDANFHLTNMPPRRKGVCDYCAGKLIQRDDDREATVKRRLTVYESQTRSLIDYYKQKGILREVSGDLDIEQLFKSAKMLFEREGLS